MKHLGFYTAVDCADYLLKKHSTCGEFENVSCVCFYEQVKEIVTALLLLGEGEIDIVSCDMHYESEEEFILTLDDFGLWIQPLTGYDNQKYIYYHTEHLLIHEDCNSLIIQYNECPTVKIASFSFDTYPDYEDTEVSSIEYAIDIEDIDESYGFYMSKYKDNTTTSYSFYSSDKELVEKTRRDVLNLFKTEEE